ncbi:MAG: hypothetical protein RJA07_340 [Bacteroidota bacterium]
MLSVFDKMKLKFIHTVFCLLMIGVFLSPNLYAQNITASAKTDSTNYTIGDHIVVNLQLNNPKHLPVVWADLNTDTSSHFEILGASKIDTTINGFSQKAVYTNFDSGNYTFPAFTFYINNNNKIDTLTTQPFSLHFKGIAVDTLKDIRTIKKPLDIPYTFREYLPYIIVIWLALAAVLAILFYFLVIRKRKLKQQNAIPEIYYTPYQKAMMKLDELEKQNLPMKDEIKLYYTTLTDILREYLETQYKIAALESTTDELMERLKYSSIDAASRMQLFELLSSADMVKFAKAKPGINEHEAALISARKFIEQTKPLEQSNPI